MTHLLLIQRNDALADAAKKLTQAGFKMTVHQVEQSANAYADSHFDLVILDVSVLPQSPGVTAQIHSGVPIVYFNPSKKVLPVQFNSGHTVIEATSHRQLLNLVNTRFRNSNKSIHLIESSTLLPGLAINRNAYFFKKKEVIYSEGHHPCSLYYIEKGKVKIFKKNNEGKELTVSLLTAGDFVGYTALLEESVYKDSAQAIEDTELTGIPKEEFEELMRTNQTVAKQFIHLLASHVSEQESQLLKLAYNSLRKRVAEALMTLVRKYKTGVQAQFSIHMSREELANMVGTATESLIRTLSDFKHEKLIQIKSGNIIIADGKRLQQIAEA